MNDFSAIIEQWARHRNETPSLPLFELLDINADRPELVTHARWLAAIENCVMSFMQIGPSDNDIIH